MNIRHETELDLNHIESTTYQAFENHPHHEPGAKPTEHLIVKRLREANALTLSLVYEEGEQLIGHIALSPVMIDGNDSRWLGLGPVSVAPSHQGKGVGSALIREALSQVKNSGFEGVVLLGEPQYYGRFGFKSQPELTLSGVPAEYFLALSFNGEIPVGQVSYHSAFYG
ncbi:GNAT family N-acetyltransferase [Vibrio fortis]|uniref:GNAT family N-acetyltransferase n=1 Tax=Vibrio fortis TaxID=212667 RepID=UPI0021C3D405|nr:N-acetyltransferase [Vibrio fortis]